MSDIYQKYDEFKNFEILFKGYDDEIHKVSGKVRAIESSNIIVYTSKKKNRFTDIPEGASIKVYVYTENGIYTADSKIIFSEDYDEDHVIYTIDYPSHSRHSQRREYFRADMNVPLKVTIVKDILSGISDTINVRSRDVCGNGVSFISEHKIPRHEEIFVSLEFPEKIIETSAKLVYTREKESHGKMYYVTALHFTTITPRNIDFIVKKCFLYQLRLKNME